MESPVVFLKQGDEFAAELLGEAGSDLAGVVPTVYLNQGRRLGQRVNLDTA